MRPGELGLPEDPETWYANPADIYGNSSAYAGREVPRAGQGERQEERARSAQERPLVDASTGRPKPPGRTGHGGSGNEQGYAVVGR